ncbi:MAG: hypothetical protein HY917_04725 [Candidatus Diapherotrites archaeon]|nr:hypothetical protein [Candidatus Diapherotrites archaeon]
MNEFILLIKTAVAISVVLLMSVLAEKVSPKLAGVLGGAPTGTPITLFFYGLESGAEFASKSAIFNLAGLLAMGTFFYLYFIAPRLLKTNNVAGSVLLAFGGYAFVIYLLHQITFEPFTATLLAVLIIPVFMYLFRKLPDMPVKQKAKLGVKTLALRAVAAAGIILFITTIASAVGPTWAGLFSAFPTTVLPLLLIIHFTYGTPYTDAILKGIPLGWLSLIAYNLVVYFAYPAYGIFMGTAMAFGVAGMYLTGYVLFKSRFSLSLS